MQFNKQNRNSYIFDKLVKFDRFFDKFYENINRKYIFRIRNIKRICLIIGLYSNRSKKSIINKVKIIE